MIRILCLRGISGGWSREMGRYWFVFSSGVKAFRMAVMGVCLCVLF
jgi:hypothetical protein